VLIDWTNVFHRNYPAAVRKGLLPRGGTAGQVLSKITATDFDTQWVAAGGGGAPTGPAGGVLGGTYPNPTFAVDMATQAELDAVNVVVLTHATRHENGGADEINVAGLSGLLADAQNPTAHATSHQNGGTDEINVAGLSGLLADGQTPLAHAASHQNGGSDEINVAGLSGLLADGQTPILHATSHQNGGLDEINVGGLSGLLADPQTPMNHAASHQNGGGDEISVAGLSGLLADPQTPLAHATSHQNGGSDELNVAGLNGLLADAQTPLAHQVSHQTGGSDALSGLVDANARVTVRKNTGADVGTRRRLNLIEGANITLTVADDAGSEEVDITIAGATGGITQLTGDVTAGPGSGSQAATIANDAVTNVKLANVATATFKGRTTAGVGDPEDLTQAQATALLNVFTSLLQGLVPASGGGTTNFLRADGSWTSPTASVAFTEFTQDLGASNSSGTFDLTGLAGLSAGKVVNVMQTASAISSKGNARDEPELDQIQATGYVVDATTIRIYWYCVSVVVGTYAFAYLISA